MTPPDCDALPLKNPQLPTIGRHSALRLMVLVFRVFGLWRTVSNHPVYILYAMLLHFVFTICYSLAICVRLFTAPQTLGDLIDAIGMSLTLIALNAKLCNVYVFMADAQLEMAENERFRLASVAERELVARRVRFFTLVAASYCAMGNTAGIAKYTNAWFTGKLPYSGWYPGLDVHENYVGLYAYQVVGMVMLSWLNLTIELFPSYLMYMISVRLEVVGKRMQALGWHRPHSERMKVAAELVEYVRQHQTLLRSAERFEQAFTRGFFAQICLSGTVICFYAYLLTIARPSDDLVLYAFYVSFMAAMVTQVFLPCYFGNELMLASERLTRHAYASNWPSMGHQYGRLMTVFVERTQRQMQITVGKMFPLSLQTFTSIISFAYKLYAVLAK